MRRVPLKGQLASNLLTAVGWRSFPTGYANVFQGQNIAAASGAHPKVAQAMMRHSDINLTMSRYSHVYAGQEADAVAALPDISLPAEQVAIATGTDGKPAGRSPKGPGKTLARNLAREGGFQRTSADFGGLKAKARRDAPENENARVSEEKRTFPKENGEAGIRTRGTGMTPYNGLANRRFQPLSHLSGKTLIVNVVSVITCENAS